MLLVIPRNRISSLFFKGYFPCSQPFNHVPKIFTVLTTLRTVDFYFLPSSQITHLSPCLSFLSIAQLSSSFLIYSLLFGIRSPSCCLQSVTVPLLSCRIQEQRQLLRAPPCHAPSAVKPHFLSPPRSIPAAAPGNQKASSEQEAQGQLLILKTVLICVCLISLMLIRAAPTSTLGC